MFYGVMLATVMPVMMIVFMGFGPDTMDAVGLSLSTGMMFSLVGAFPFTGVGFLESKAQLWVIQGAPRGAMRYVRARVLMAVVSDVVLTLVPIIVISLLTTMPPLQLLELWGFGCTVAIGSSMVGIGSTARNPDYEDTKSPAHQANVMTAIMIPMFTIMGSVFLLVALFEMNLDSFFVGILGSLGLEFLTLALGPALLLVIGAAFVKLGTDSLSRPD
jgi:hypothetical protein